MLFNVVFGPRQVNTCNSMGLFKEMLCDGSMNGQALPRNVKVTAGAEERTLLFSLPYNSPYNSPFK
jgi:hypothetical protein